MIILFLFCYKKWGLSVKEKIDYLSALFVGIDIASRIHVISALDFNQAFFIKMKPVPNTPEGTVLLESMIADVLKEYHQFKYVVIGVESTGFYGVHLANYLSSSDLLAPFSVRVYCLNRYHYYIIEAIGSVIRHCPEYEHFYHKKYAETRNHQHKRALALTSHKFIRLLFGLLDKSQLYSPK